MTRLVLITTTTMSGLTRNNIFFFSMSKHKKQAKHLKLTLSPGWNSKLKSEFSLAGSNIPNLSMYR